MLKPLKVYTDGSSNPHEKREELKGRAGWAVVIPFSPTNIRVFYGHCPPPATNNVGELQGLINALMITRNLKGMKQFYVDSQYAIKCQTEWRRKWERSGMPVKNTQLIRDLWHAYDQSIGTKDIRWVKGHSDSTYNEIADEYAKKGRDKHINSGSMGYVTYRGFSTPEEFLEFVQTVFPRNN